MIKHAKFPLPKRFWIFLFISAIFAILYFLNIFLTDDLTGDKEFWDFTKTDWLYFAAFVLTEIIIMFFMVFFSLKAGKISASNRERIEAYFRQFAYDALPDDYDDVWFDFDGYMRAIITRKSTELFYLRLEVFNVKSEAWDAVNTVSIYDSLDAIKKALYDEFNFICDENVELAELDDGDEDYGDSRA